MGRNGSKAAMVESDEVPPPPLVNALIRLKRVSGDADDPLSPLSWRISLRLNDGDLVVVVVVVIPKPLRLTPNMFARSRRFIFDPVFGDGDVFNTPYNKEFPIRPYQLAFIKHKTNNAKTSVSAH